MPVVKEACEESCLFHDHPKCFIHFNFHSFSIILPTSRHKKDCISVVICPMGLQFVSLCCSHDSALDSVTFIV